MDNNNVTPCGLPQPKPVRLVEPVNISTDWQHYRIQAAIAAMQGMMASEFYCNTKTRNDAAYTKYREKWDARTIAKEAVACADLLIEELQKKGGNNEDD